MTESKTKPEIRFAGFTDAWEQRKLGEVAEFSKGYGYSKSDLREVGTPIILYGRLYTKFETVISMVDTFTAEKENSVFSKGGEVIVPASGETADDISRASVVENAGIILGGDLNVIKPKPTIDPAFLAIILSNGPQKKELSKRAQGKSVVHIHNSDLQDVMLVYPKPDEQRLIRTLFGGFDNLITLHQREYDKTVNIKKAMLEKMFPKDGEDKPEIRFAGFTDAWEQRKADDIFKTSVDKGYPELPVLSATQDKGMIRREETGISIAHDQKNEATYKRVLPGQFVIHLRSFQGGFAHSNVEGITSPAYTVLDFVEKYRHYDWFWKYIFSSESFVKRLETVTYGIRDGRSISNDDFSEMKFQFPSFEEQRGIGETFVTLDHLITLHQRELEKLQNMKKALLEKMFV